MPKLIAMGKVEYPQSARKAGAAGMVMIKGLVSVEGRIAEAAIESGVEGYPELGASALQAVREATFSPGLRAGKPVASWVKIPVQFALR
jgi:protein TonB